MGKETVMAGEGDSGSLEVGSLLASSIQARDTTKKSWVEEGKRSNVNRIHGSLWIIGGPLTSIMSVMCPGGL